MIKQLVKPVLTGKGPNFSSLSVKECYIGDYRLQYRLPGNAIDIGKPKKSRPTRVNLRDDLFTSYDCEKEYNRNFVRMEFDWWAYKGLFFQGDSGLLSRVCMYIDVNRVEPHTQVHERDLNSLESYLKKDYWDYYETELNTDGKPGTNWQKRYNFENPEELLAKGYVPPDTLVLVHLPENYDKVAINGTEWLHYHIKGEGIPGLRHTYYWAYPLTDKFYLTFSFWMTTEVGNRDLKVERMFNDAKRTMSMVELHKG